MSVSTQISFAEFQSIFDGSPEDFSAYLYVCVDTFSSMYQSYLQSIADNNYDLFRHVRHAVKPILAQAELHDFIEELESVAQENADWVKRAKQLAPEFSAIIDAFRSEAGRL